MQFVVPMAEALAVMHWDALRDATDIEFVLGSPRESGMSAGDFDELDHDGLQTTWQQKPSSVAMWLFDFNQVGRIRKEEACIDKLVWAFWNNDPYYPRPAEKELWDAFKEASLARSARYGDASDLSRAFISKIEEDAKTRLPTMQGPPKYSDVHPQVSAPAAKKGKKRRRYAGMP
jgi:hypothetical protein